MALVNWQPGTPVPFIWKLDVVFPYGATPILSQSTNPSAPPATVGVPGVQADISGSSVVQSDASAVIHLQSNRVDDSTPVPVGAGAVQQGVMMQFSVNQPATLRLIVDLSEYPYTQDAYVVLQDSLTGPDLLSSAHDICAQTIPPTPCHFDKQWQLVQNTAYTLTAVCQAEINADHFPGVSPNTLNLVAMFTPTVGFTFSPLNAIPASDSPVKLAVAPAAGELIDAVRVTATSPVTDSDSQWIELGLTLPIGFEIKGVQVCYMVDGSNAYIAQTRLTQMSTPNVATVLLDDATQRTSETPVCYDCTGGGIVVDTITLSLKIVIEDTSAAIRIGGIKILG